MTANATSSNTNASYQFTTGIGQIGSTWPPTTQTSRGVPADGYLDGVGLVGLDNPASTPYAVRGPAVPGTRGREFYDLMSYCTGGNDALGWISVRNWNYDVNFHAPAASSLGGDIAAEATRNASGAPLAAPAKPAERTFIARPPASMASARTLAVTSYYDISTGRALLTNVAPDASAPTPGSSGATYTLVGRDGAGNPVSTGGTITNLFHIDPSPGHTAASVIAIEGKLPAANVREVDVLQNGIPIVQDRASAHAPTAGLLHLRGAERIGGPQGAVFHWRSHDADGNTLQVTLEYSPDGGRTWKQIFSGADTGSASLPGNLLSASRNARIRLYVSDGFNETIVTSPRLVSPGVPPETVITSPMGGSMTRSASAAIDLGGSAYDDTGRRLTGRALSWHAGHELLGFGTQITTTALAAGRHRVTLTARDRSGRIGTASVTIRVVSAPPTLTVLKAPHRISSKARKLIVRIATLAADTLNIGRARVVLGRHVKAVRIPVKPGRKTLTLTLVLHSGRYATTVRLAILR